MKSTLVLFALVFQVRIYEWRLEKFEVRGILEILESFHYRPDWNDPSHIFE